MSVSFVDSTYDHVIGSTYMQISSSGFAGLTDDDIMIAMIVRIADDSDPITVPSGWSLEAESDDGYGEKYWLYSKIASSESSAYTWEWSANKKGAIYAAAYRGDFSKSSPFAVISNTIYRSADTNVRAASMSVPDANSTLIFMGCMYRTLSSVTFTPPSVLGTWTEDVDDGDTGSDCWFEFARYEWSSSGSTGNMDATASVSYANKHAFAFALTPQITIEDSLQTVSSSLALGSIDDSATYNDSVGGISSTLSIGDVDVSNIFWDVLETLISSQILGDIVESLNYVDNLTSLSSSLVLNNLIEITYYDILETISYALTIGNVGVFLNYADSLLMISQNSIDGGFEEYITIQDELSTIPSSLTIPMIDVSFGPISGLVEVDEIEVIGHNKIRVHFDEYMKKDVELIDTDNYSIVPITPGAVSPYISVVNTPDVYSPTYVDLLTSEMTIGAIYEVVVSLDGPTSLEGNTLDKDFNTGQFVAIGDFPVIKEIIPIGENRLDIVFSKNMLDNDSIRNKNNYTFDNGLETISVVSVFGDTVSLVTSNQIPGAIYNLTISP